MRIEGRCPGKVQEDQKLYERVEAAVDKRLRGKRLKHVHSVSTCAVELAHTYGVNEFDAKVAGILHDWDKLLTDDELVERMHEFDLEVPEHYELLYPVLHAFTGAAAVHREFPELSDDIISAIYKHSLGDLEMSDLDKVIFIADMIEPLRDASKRPRLKKIRKKVGKVSLDDLYWLSYIDTMAGLVERKRFIHPAAFDIWNDLVAKHHKVDKSKQGDPDVVL